MPKKIKNKTNPGHPPATGDLIREEYENGGYVEKHYQEPVQSGDIYDFEITSDKSIIAANGTDMATITITLLLNDTHSDNKDGITYYLPIFKADRTQYWPLVQIVFTNGVASFDFTTDKSSFYSFDLARLRPMVEAGRVPSLQITAT